MRTLSPHQEYMTAYITGNEQWFDAACEARRPGDSIPADS